MSSVESTAEPYHGACANCATDFTGHYCPHCGQEAHIEVPSAGEFLHEFAHHYVALEGAMGHTLRVLFLRPGQLTLDYLRGVRQRYVRPLRLYLSFSVVFFVLQVLLGAQSGGAGVELSVQERAEVAAAAQRTPEADVVERAAGGLAGKLAELAGDPARLERVNLLVRRYTPHAMFILLPAFAALLALIYRNRRQRYGAHLLFALHAHAVLFAGLIIDLAPLPGFLSFAIYLALAAHLGLACQRVYGGRPALTAVRVGLLLAGYLAVVGAVLIVGVTTAVLLA